MNPGRKQPIRIAAPIASGEAPAPCMKAKELRAALPARVMPIAGLAQRATTLSVASRTVTSCASSRRRKPRSVPQALMIALRHPAEVVVDRWRPAGRRHVEVHGARERVGVREPPRVAVPRLVHGIDAQRCAMGEQRRLAVAVERHERIPEAVFGLGQLLRPLLVTRLDRLGGNAIGESRRLRAEVDAPRRSSAPNGIECL